MENLIKSLTDEVDNLHDAVDRMRAARNNGRRAVELEAEAEVQITFAKVQERITEIRKRLGL